MQPLKRPQTYVRLSVVVTHRFAQYSSVKEITAKVEKIKVGTSVQATSFSPHSGP